MLLIKLFLWLVFEKLMIHPFLFDNIYTVKLHTIITPLSVILISHIIPPECNGK